MMLIAHSERNLDIFMRLFMGRWFCFVSVCNATELAASQGTEENLSSH